MRRSNFCLVAPLFATAICAAQAPSFQPTPDDTQWIQSRVNFLAKMYELNPAQQKQLLDASTALAAEQAAYQNNPSVKQTLRSLQVGMDQAMTTTADDVRGPVLDRLNAQLYGIYTKAPMSYANVLSKLEPTLPKDQVDKGYGNMKVHFANQLRGGKIDLKRENVDILAGQAVELPSLSNKKLTINIPPAAPPANVNVTPQAAQANPMTPPPAKPPMPLPPTPPTAVKPLPPPPPPPREYGPAPAKDTWAATVDSVAAKYSFKPDQLAQAKKILDQANKLAENAKDAKPMSEIYGVMNDRVTALATMEQRIKVDGEKAVVPAKPSTPSATGPIKIVPQPPKGATVIDAGVPGAAKPATPPPAAPPTPAKPEEAKKP